MNLTNFKMGSNEHCSPTLHEKEHSYVVFEFLIYSKALKGDWLVFTHPFGYDTGQTGLVLTVGASLNESSSPDIVFIIRSLYLLYFRKHYSRDCICLQGKHFSFSSVTDAVEGIGIWAVVVLGLDRTSRQHNIKRLQVNFSSPRMESLRAGRCKRERMRERQCGGNIWRNKSSAKQHEETGTSPESGSNKDSQTVTHILACLSTH